ncbi:MAG: SCP2 sterol-binding domain-containing protein [Alphaproteobacteria bacterium]
MSLAQATETIKAKVAQSSGFSARVKFNFKEEGVIHIDSKAQPPAVSNEDLEADCTITMSLDNFNKMVAGELDPTMAFMMGKLKVSGDMAIAMRLGQLI